MILNVKKILCLLLALQLTSCLYSEEEESARELFNSSNEVPIESIFKEITEITTTQDLTQKKVGEGVHYELNQRVFTGSIYKSHDIVTSIICKHDPDVNGMDSNCAPSTPEEENYIIYKVSNFIATADDSDVDQEKPYMFYIPKPLAATTTKAVQPKSLHSHLYAKNDVSAFANTYSYHNLRVIHFKGDPPQKVKDSDNCGGIKDCLIDIKQITYDRLNKDTAGVTHHIMMLSPQVPFLSMNPPLDGPNKYALFYYDGILNECIHQWVTLADSDTKVYVSNCRVLRDFKF
ncbi:MAG: hypothetical protein HOO06_16910 [Bdellovibrionaceae bacterium]|nr:hypothetical protein [Pseudobdellovibrionaceae bacterium]